MVKGRYLNLVEIEIQGVILFAAGYHGNRGRFLYNEVLDLTILVSAQFMPLIRRDFV